MPRQSSLSLPTSFHSLVDLAPTDSTLTSLLCLLFFLILHNILEFSLTLSNHRDSLGSTITRVLTRLITRSSLRSLLRCWLILLKNLTCLVSYFLISSASFTCSLSTTTFTRGESNFLSLRLCCFLCQICCFLLFSTLFVKGNVSCSSFTFR